MEDIGGNKLTQKHEIIIKFRRDEKEMLEYLINFCSQVITVLGVTKLSSKKEKTFVIQNLVERNPIYNDYFDRQVMELLNEIKND